MIDEKLREIIADADREIAEALKPEGGQFGVGAKPPPARPVMNMVISPANQLTETPEEAAQKIMREVEPLHQALERHNSKLVELLGFVSLTITDVEDKIGKRLDAIERILGVPKP